MNLFKIMLGTFLGLIIFFVVLVVVVISIAGASMVETPASIQSNSVFKISLDRPIVEKEDQRFVTRLRRNITGGEAGVGLYDLIEAIQLAKANESVKGIYLEVGIFEAGYSTLYELRNALEDFKKSGKFIYAYGEILTEKSYYISSVADQLYMPESGLIELNGLKIEVLYFKNLFEKLELKTEVFKAGEFKSAVEPYISDHMSENDRIQSKALMEDLYNEFLDKVSASRKISKEKLFNISDSMKVRNSDAALSNNIITAVGYLSDLKKAIATKVGVKESKDIHWCSYKSLLSNKPHDLEVTESVAVIYATGEIVQGGKNQNYISPENLIPELRKAAEDDNIKAVVLRINSPGGSALASDVIWNEILQLKAKKPVVASMSDVAASGGYYMAMACDKIVATPNTITGSIGVFGLFVHAENLLQNKLGINSDREKIGRYADIGSFSKGMNDDERAIIQQEIEHIYGQFLSKAAKGRKMPVEEIGKHAGGRVWSGADAITVGLVDTLGGINDAIALAAKLGKLKAKEYKVVQLPNNDAEDFLELLGNDEEVYEEKQKALLQEFYPYLEVLQDMHRVKGIQTRLPYYFSIN
ncbi:MAG: sppA [Cytophagaceae bacterium]|jgi:protease-4|nr:sppA [Cytophagaceae bacterium]